MASSDPNKKSIKASTSTMALEADDKFTRNILEEINVSPSLMAACKKAGYVSAVSILTTTEEELEMVMEVPAYQVCDLICQVASHVLPPRFTASDLNISGQGRPKSITTGCKGLDAILGGGVPVRGITEVYGESGSGKTQFALQLSLCAQLPPEAGGLGKRVAYICTEAQFPIKRLQQLINHFEPLYSREFKISLIDNIFVHHIPDLDSFVNCVKHQLPKLVQHHNVGLVVLDSVAAPFRPEHDITDACKAMIFTLGYSLHQLHASHEVAVLAINQVSDNPDVFMSNFLREKKIPALGLTWSTLVTTQLRIERTGQHVPVHQSDGKDNVKTWSIRRLKVMLCPWEENKYHDFIITSRGIEDVSEIGG